MKKQTLAAYICAAITLGMFSCDWFDKDHKAAVLATPSIVGKWRVTSMYDTSIYGKKMKEKLFDLNSDSLNVFATFSPDSILTLANAEKAVDTSRYYIDSLAKKIIVEGHGESNAFEIVTLNDSLLKVRKESLFFNLKRLP